MTPSERALVVRLRAREESAFAELEERYAPLLHRIAARHVSGSQAEDVVQETWMAVLSGIDRFEGRSSVATWLYAIAQNRARSRGEREARQVPLLDEELLEASSHARSEDVPHEQLAASESSAAVARVVGRLSPSLRPVLELRDLCGYSAQETCELLGIDDLTQRVRLHRAREQVRRALRKELLAA